MSPARRRRRPRPRKPLLGRLLGGLDVRQVVMLVGALAGGGGLVKLDAGAAGQRTTATASLAVSALEDVYALRESVDSLRREVARLRRRQARTATVAPDTMAVVQWAAASPPQRPTE